MKVLFTLGALLGAFAVILGAFGAHKLKLVLSPEQLQTFETGVKYHFYHVFAIAIVGLLWLKYPSSGWVWAGWFFVIGIVFFSGSLYLLANKETLGLSNVTKFIGPITPIGGLLFIVGWVTSAIQIFKSIEN
jgi:uncharacterized membrane protein YgdD (TMEM256/DUF423 family)